MIKKIILGVMVIGMLGTVGFSNLLEELDKLSPEEAVQFQELLLQKSIESVPGSFGGGLYFQNVNPSALNNAFPGADSISTLYGVGGRYMTPINDSILVGGKFTAAGNFTNNQSSSNIFEDLILAYGTTQFVIDYRMINSNNFILSSSLGFGVLMGGYEYAKTDENTPSTYSTYRWGTGLCYSLALDASWVDNNGWGGGMGLEYFSGKLDDLRRVIDTEDTAAPDLDLTGWSFKLFGSKYF